MCFYANHQDNCTIFLLLFKNICVNVPRKKWFLLFHEFTVLVAESNGSTLKEFSILILGFLMSDENICL